MDSKKNGGEDYIVRIRGLPWSAKESDVREFFAACEQINCVHFTFTKEGRPTGEAYLELGSSRDVDMALLKHKENLQNRYIEVFAAKRGEMEFVLRRRVKKEPTDSETTDFVVRLRGLPFGSTNQDIIDFFAGLEIAPDGIVRPTDKSGRVTGEAYVKFLDKESTEKALDKHKQEIGNRYIEVFRSTNGEIYLAKYPYGGGPEDHLYFNEDGTYGGGMPKFGRKPAAASGGGGIPSLLDDIDFTAGSGPGYMGAAGLAMGEYGAVALDATPKHCIGMATGHMVHMHGIPFKATATDIVEFFKPLKVLNILVLFDENTGKCLGEADVEFLTHQDAVDAMQKHKQHMGERYVDLVLDSIPPPTKVDSFMDPTSDDVSSANNGFPQPLASVAADGSSSAVTAVMSAAMAPNPYYDPTSGMVQYPGYPPAAAAYPYGYSQYPPSYY